MSRWRIHFDHTSAIVEVDAEYPAGLARLLVDNELVVIAGTSFSELDGQLINLAAVARFEKILPSAYDDAAG